MPITLFVHVSWTTLERRPMIDQGVAQFLRRFLPAEAKRHGTEVLAMGIVADHVHMVLRLPAAFNVPRALQGFKGASARLVNADPCAVIGLRWAAGYDARSVSPRSIREVIDYVLNQSRHHPDRVVDGPPPEVRPKGTTVPKD